MVAKKKRMRKQCELHYATNRSWSMYQFGYINHNGVEVYKCIQCTQRWEQWQKNYDKRKLLAQEVFERKWRESDERQKEREKRQKDELWDFVVADELKRGMKLKHEVKFPKEVLQLKRATMLLERAIKNKREKYLAEQAKLIEEAERLKRPVVECRKHGMLFLKDVIRGGFSRWTGVQRYKCKQCMKNSHQKYYQKYKEDIAVKHKRYRDNNIEIRKLTKANSYRKSKDAKDRNNEPTTQ